MVRDGPRYLLGFAMSSFRSLLGYVGAALMLGATSVAATARAQAIVADGGFVPCSVDADCGNPYLACVDQAVEICSEVDAATALKDSPPGCLATKPVTMKLCSPTYQQPCHVDSDCGPAGFTCNPNGGRLCSPSGCESVSRCDAKYTLCASAADCPAGWSCSLPSEEGPGCPTLSCPDAAPLFPPACYPPFAFGLAAIGNGPGPATGLDAGASRATGAALPPAPLPQRVPPAHSASGCAIVAGARSRRSADGAAALALVLGVVAARRRRGGAR
jgi:hypothetical protein